MAKNDEEAASKALHEGRSPAELLVRRDGIGVVDDLINRVRYGIYP